MSTGGNVTRYAVVAHVGGRVDNVVLWDGATEWAPPTGYDAITDAAGIAQIGGTWNGTTFVSPIVAATKPPAAPAATCAGTITLAVLDGTSKAVVFDTPMPDTNYEVIVSQKAGVAVTATPTAFMPTGFTLTVATALAGSFGYVAVHH